MACAGSPLQRGVGCWREPPTNLPRHLKVLSIHGGKGGALGWLALAVLRMGAAGAPAALLGHFELPSTHKRKGEPWLALASPLHKEDCWCKLLGRPRHNLPKAPGRLAPALTIMEENPAAP